MKTTKLTKTALPFAAVALLAATNASFASTVSLGTLTSFTGGDAGEGLDLTGNIVSAFNLGGTAQTVQGVNFVAADRTSLPTGLTMTGTAGNQFNYTGANPAGANAADYGATSDDDALETMVTSVWYDGSWTLDLAVTSGTQYQLQLIFQEGFHKFQGVDGSTANGRKTDISLEGVLGLANFEPGIETNGLAQGGSDFGMVYTYTFTATDDSFTVSLDTVAGANENAILGAVTLEQVPEPSTTALLGLGGLALILRRRK
jgi:hypothetical protein